MVLNEFNRGRRELWELKRLKALRNRNIAKKKAEVGKLPVHMEKS